MSSHQRIKGQSSAFSRHRPSVPQMIWTHTDTRQYLAFSGGLDVWISWITNNISNTFCWTRRDVGKRSCTIMCKIPKHFPGPTKIGRALNQHCRRPKCLQETFQEFTKQALIRHLRGCYTDIPLWRMLKFCIWEFIGLLQVLWLLQGSLKKLIRTSL